MTAQEFVLNYCRNSKITEDEFYQNMIPMPDKTSPSGWAAVNNTPLSVKTHIKLYSPSMTATDILEELE